MQRARRERALPLPRAKTGSVAAATKRQQTLDSLAALATPQCLGDLTAHAGITASKKSPAISQKLC